MASLFLSTPSARRATRQATLYLNYIIISIHALREEGDLLRHPAQTVPDPFLSTPSARRATLELTLPQALENISIHALREEGDLIACRDFLSVWISIHALREEGDY